MGLKDSFKPSKPSSKWPSMKSVSVLHDLAKAKGFFDEAPIVSEDTSFVVFEDEKESERGVCMEFLSPNVTQAIVHVWLTDVSTSAWPT